MWFRFRRLNVCSSVLAIAAAFAALEPTEGRAQVDLNNIQTQLQIYTVPLTAGIVDIQQLNGTSLGACLDNAVILVHLARLQPDLIEKLGADVPPDEKGKPDDQNQRVRYFRMAPHRQEVTELLNKFFRENPDAEDKINKSFQRPIPRAIGSELNVTQYVFKFGIPPAPVPFCKNQSITKLSFPLNPTVESNVLKNNQNNSFGTSWGYGGTIQVVMPAPDTSDDAVSRGAEKKKNFDVIGVSAQSTSVRYDKFPTKSLDTVITQAAYQHFLDAFNGGTRIDADTPNAAIPPLNMITIYSVAFGFQNQTVYLPTFRGETVDLLTPQVTYNIQNIGLSPIMDACYQSTLDPRQKGYCRYIDLAFTAGQTFSDVSSQQNANIAVSATPGVRIDKTDWKVTLPITATARAYEDVVGGRDDLLLQIGPALTYASQTYADRSGDAYAVQFSLSATYNRNFSTVAASAWRGYIVMPTLTLAFQPPPPPAK